MRWAGRVAGRRWGPQHSSQRATRAGPPALYAMLAWCLVNYVRCTLFFLHLPSALDAAATCRARLATAGAASTTTASTAAALAAPQLAPRLCLPDIGMISAFQHRELKSGPATLQSAVTSVAPLLLVCWLRGGRDGQKINAD